VQLCVRGAQAGGGAAETQAAQDHVSHCHIDHGIGSGVSGTANYAEILPGSQGFRV